MAIVEAHHAVSAAVDELLGLEVCYQKHKPGKNLSMERMPGGYFQIESIRQFGTHLVLNDGVVVMEGAPTVIRRQGRIAILLPTGEELYFFAR